jgi:hypothetical protein
MNREDSKIFLISDILIISFAYLLVATSLIAIYMAKTSTMQDIAIIIFISALIINFYAFHLFNKDQN